MRPPLRLLAGAACCALIAPGTAAQHEDPELAVRALEREWDAARARGEVLGVSARRESIIGLLARHGEQPRPSIWRMRLRLAELELCMFALAAAQAQYARVAGEVDPRATDLRGEAELGLATCQSALGDVTAARASYARITEQLPGTRYALHADAALRRLDAEKPPAGAGDHMPALPRLLDLAGRPQELGFPRAEPTLLVFWSPDTPAAADALEAAARHWQALGLPRGNLLAFGIADAPELLRETLRARGLDATVVACPRGALDPAVLALRVASVPTLLLVGPDGTILARDFAAARLPSLLRREQ